jgi:hypothetical protein
MEVKKTMILTRFLKRDLNIEEPHESETRKAMDRKLVSRLKTRKLTSLIQLNRTSSKANGVTA